MAFRARKVFGTFEKRAPGLALKKRLKAIRKWPILKFEIKLKMELAASN